MSFLEISLFAVLASLFVFWLWSLVDCITRDHERGLDKIAWLIVMLGAWALGSFAYLVFGRPHTKPRRPEPVP